VDELMDFMNRGTRPPVQHNGQGLEGPAGAHKAPGATSAKSRKKLPNKLVKIGSIAFLLSVAVLIIAIVFALVFVKNSDTKEATYVDKGKLQAVFLNGGQVYFGKISDLNSKYLNMNNIYYLRVNQQVQPGQTNTNANDISLVKLGCELHGPQDSMTINREQVIFWENLKADGQVAKAVEDYVKANPDGQKCDQQQSTGANTNTNTNNSTSNTTNNSSTNSTTNSNTPKPATP
jgi:hypothetical protein